MANFDNLHQESLGKMPGHVFTRVRDYFDKSQDRCHAFLDILGGRYSNLYRRTDHMSGKDVLCNLNGLGMTIGEFVQYAAQSQDMELLQICGQRVPVTVSETPRAEVVVFEGEPLSLSVRASGSPRPRYQWLKDGSPVNGAQHSTYLVHSAQVTHKGVYQCELFDGETGETLGNTSPSTVLIYRPCPLEISVQPRACRVEVGGTALFYCQADRTDGVSYQWYKDDETLHDSQLVRGTRTSELRLYQVSSEEWQGSYHCIISRGHQQVYSQGAPLQMVNLAQETNPSYTATDKVALLIGCSDYRGDKVLAAPRFDVQTLASAFQLLNFKVVSLLDLTKGEIISAIHEFQQLVGPGVYCVFYFCGHGFEDARNGLDSHCFLVPVDAPVNYDQRHCVSARLVFSCLLERNPSICCMILDICRKSLDSAGSIKLLDDLGSEGQKSVDFYSGCNGAGKSIVCYGTCYGLAAYEDKKYGVFVSHLKNFLTEPIGIDRVFEKLRDALGRDQRVHNGRRLQVAEVKSNLTQPGRSFCDAIVYSGFTAQFNRNQDIWERAHMKPDPHQVDVVFPTFTIQVRLTFQQEFSNVLKVYVTVLDPGPALQCVAYVSEVPVRIADKSRTMSIPSSNGRIHNTYVSIRNIQELRANMQICVSARVTLADGSHQVATTPRVDLQLPLVASLQLWREWPPLAGHREGVEEEEEG